MAININNLSSNSQVKQKLDQQVQVKQQVTQNAASIVEVRLGGDGDARVTDDGIVLFYNGTNYYNGFVSEYVAD